MSSAPGRPRRLSRLAKSPLASAFTVLAIAATVALMVTVVAKRAHQPPSHDRELESFVTRVFGDKTASVDFAGRPLAEVIDGIARDGEAPVRVDWPSLAPLHLTPDAPTVARFKGMRTETAIRAACARVTANASSLTWTRDDDGKGLRLINMHDPRFHVVRRYLIGDILLENRQGRANLMRNLAEYCVFVDDKALARDARIEGYELVVSHSPRGHQQVVQILDFMRTDRTPSWLVAALREVGP